MYCWVHLIQVTLIVATYYMKKLVVRHKNLLSMPNWTKEELSELSKNLRRKTKLAMLKKEIHMNRLEQLLKNAQSTLTYENIKDMVLYGGQL
jgi:hypothetical protein